MVAQGDAMKYRFIFILTLLAALTIVTACAPGGAITSTLAPSTSSAQEGATLVQERCTACHPLSRVENARFSAANWKIVVDTMIARGAQLTPEEETIVVNYLAAKYGQ